jgi:nicotinamide-nucleotide amidase
MLVTGGVGGNRGVSVSQEPTRMAQELGILLLRRGWLLATAESCTGGWLAKRVTDVPGSSAWFERGFVTYANAAKVEMLGVREQTLLEHGAVSDAAVREMAEGALAHSHADVVVAISGVAGPDGGTPDKPVGLVWIAWALRGEPVQAEHYQFGGDREAVRLQAVEMALRGLVKRLET